MNKKRIVSIILILSLLSTVVAYGATTLYSKYASANYTHATRFDNALILNGIDISQWNQDINWQKVKADGIDYVIIRIGGRGYGASGRLYFDDNAKQYFEGAKAAGLMIGGYFFSQAITEAEAIDEANYTKSLLDRYGLDGSDFDLPIFMDREFAWDSEDAGRLVTAKLSKDAETKIEKAFCDRLKALGFDAGLYANLLYLNNNTKGDSLVDSGYVIWEAQYNDQCDYQGKYSIWQYTSEGKVDGITTNTDCNFWYLNKSLEAVENAGTSIEAFQIEVPDVVVSGSGPYIPEITVKVPVAEENQEDQVTPEGDQNQENQEAPEGEATPKNEQNSEDESKTEEVKLVEGTDYKIIKYLNNDEPGQAYAIIRGIGKYTGYRAVPFNIILSGNLQSNIYQVGKYVTGISAETSAEGILDKFTVDSGYTKKLLDKAGNEVASSCLVGTGMTIAIYDNTSNLVGSVPIVVKGDATGDGHIRATDYMRIKSHIMGSSDKLANAYYQAADVNGDTYIRATDYMRIKGHIMGNTVIK